MVVSLRAFAIAATHCDSVFMHAFIRHVRCLRGMSTSRCVLTKGLHHKGDRLAGRRDVMSWVTGRQQVAPALPALTLTEFCANDWSLTTVSLVVLPVDC